MRTCRSSKSLSRTGMRSECLNQGTKNAAACSFAARLARSGLYQWRDGTPAGLQTRSALGQDTRSGQGALARRHTDGPLRAALLKTTAMCKAWRLLHYARPPPDPSRTLELLSSFSHYNSVLDTDTGTGPIPSITVSGVNAYSGGVLARALPEGLRYLST